jgi:peptide/nickel transport system substrate-binding protein
VEWDLGSHVTIERNDDYWLPERVPHIDSFTIQVIADVDSAVQSVMVGESDAMRGMAPAQFEGVQKANPHIDILTYDNMGWTAFLMNADPELGAFFSETDIRRAMMYAVDREMIVQTMLDGIGTPAVGVQPPGSPAYAPDEVTTVYTYDPGLANSLLDQAGWIDADDDGVRERNGIPFRMDFLYSDSAAVNEQLVPYLTQVFRDIGVEVIPRSLPQPTMVEQVVAGDYQLATFSIFWTLDDLGVLYRCDAMPPAGFNLARHCNAEYDRLNSGSAAEMDADKRRRMIIDQGNISNDDAHYGLLYFTQGVVPVNSRVKNLFFSAFGEMWSLTDAWIEAE